MALLSCVISCSSAIMIYPLYLSFFSPLSLDLSIFSPLSLNLAVFPVYLSLPLSTSLYLSLPPSLPLFLSPRSIVPYLYLSLFPCLSLPIFNLLSISSNLPHCQYEYLFPKLFYLPFLSQSLCPTFSFTLLIDQTPIALQGV